MDDIKHFAMQFFSSLFSDDRRVLQTSSCPFQFPQISQEDNNMLGMMPSIDGLKDVVFSLDDGSAARLDSFGAGFYQRCWNIMKQDLLDAVEDFY